MATKNEATGMWEAVIDPGQGPSKVQKFSAPTLEELTTKMETAQLHATQRISQLSEFTELDGAEDVPEFKPRTLTADEQFQIGQDMQDPTKAAAAMERLMEAVIGAKPEQIRSGLKSAKLAHLIQHYRSETQDFIDDTPEYKKSPANWQAMMAWLDAKKAPPSKKNLLLAFTALKDAVGGLPDGISSLEPENPPATEEAPEEGQEHIAPARVPERIAPATPPTTRPRGSQNSGLRNGNSSISTPPPPAPKWTKASVMAMGAAEYEGLYKMNPKFREFVDKM